MSKVDLENLDLENLNTQGICQARIIALLPLNQQCQECYYEERDRYYEESKEEQDE